MNAPLLGVVAAVLAATGAYLIYTSVASGPRPPSVGAHRHLRRRASVREWLAQAGLADVRPVEFAAVSGLLFMVGGLGAFVLFGGLVPSVAAGCLSATVPIASYRSKRRARLVTAAQAWPRLLEELRLLTGSVGRSIPQALFEVGRKAPAEWRGAFAAAEREWLLTTDFSRTIELLKERLADPTADAVCETLVVAHEVGGSELESRLGELIEDRIQDVQGRKDAISKQAGVRFARRFVLLVPLGMTLAGLSIGTGRASYETPGGQLAVVVGLAAVAACWLWSGRLLRLPEQPRVFR